jgi:hypothetical protein
MNGTDIARADRVSWWQAALMLRGQTKVDQRNLMTSNAWSCVWVVGFCAVTFLLKTFPDFRGPLAWTLAMIPIVLGLFAVRATLRFLREADEFTRKVQLEGIAWGFGAGSLFAIGYNLLERFGAPAISMIFMLVPLTLGWAVGSLLVAARYR